MRQRPSEQLLDLIDHLAVVFTVPPVEMVAVMCGRANMGFFSSHYQCNYKNM
jgi:hypothetical protein